MKFSILQITLIIAAQCSAFVTQPTFSRRSTLVLNAKKRTQKAQRPNSKAAASKPPSPVDLSQPAVELEPEPEGGEEIQAVSTMPGSRMKNMGEAPEVKTKDGGTAYKFWLTAQAGGPLIKEINTRVLKDASKKAEFPGFRKGQVPPFAMPQIRGFAVQEGLIQTVQAAAEAYGLKAISGSDGEVTILEDVATVLAKSYKLGDDIQFTCTFKATVDPEKKAAAKPVASDVIDAEVVEAEVVEAEVVEE